MLSTRRVLPAISIILLSACAWAQEQVTRCEAGAQFTALDLTGSLGEKPAGFGGRFAYNLNRYLAVETEANYFPQNPDGDFGQTQFLAGIRAGFNIDGIGVYAKLRPGFVHFGGAAFRVYNGNNPTRPALDIGGLVQYLPRSRRVGLRVDWGDTLVSLPALVRPTGSASTTAGGVQHTFQAEIGVVVRF
jgi:hypothetical protein